MEVEREPRVRAEVLRDTPSEHRIRDQAEVCPARPRHLRGCDRDAGHLDLQQARPDLGHGLTRRDRRRELPVPIVLLEPEVARVVPVAGFGDQIEDDVADREVGRADAPNLRPGDLFEPVFDRRSSSLTSSGGSWLRFRWR